MNTFLPLSFPPPSLPHHPAGKTKSKKKLRSKSGSSLKSASASSSSSSSLGYCGVCDTVITEQNCTLCQIFRRYTGRPYWGHVNSAWPQHSHTHVDKKKKRKKKVNQACSHPALISSIVLSSHRDVYWFES